MNTSSFWESRAQRFAGAGRGLAAVCSYGMPGFYNFAIDWTQRAALAPVLRSMPRHAQVLEYGCGIGRWSRRLARRGASVLGVDFAAAMLEEARRRTALAGYADVCRYRRADVTTLELGQRFDLVLGVTVLQHVLDDVLLARAIAALSRHLRPGGRLVLLEAAPNRPESSADTATFRARTLDRYLDAIRAAGLAIETVRGVDPAPFKLWVVPRFARWPRPVAVTALALATLAALPIDLLLARSSRGSWHKLIVARAV